MEYTPPLFSDNHITNEINGKLSIIKNEENQNTVLDQDTNEEDDFEIPAFLEDKNFNENSEKKIFNPYRNNHMFL